MSRDCKDGEFILMGTKWNKLCISKNKGGSGLQKNLNLLTWLCWLSKVGECYLLKEKSPLYFLIFNFFKSVGEY